jgi:hypothetical protein
MKAAFILMILFLVVAPGCQQINNETGKQSNSSEKYRINDNDDTVLLNYRTNKTLLSEVTVKNGMRNGLCLNYYENGKVQNEITYKDDVKIGRSTWNYESGKLYRESNYVDGKIEGIQKLYYEDGGILAEVPYKNGKLQTGTKEYNKDGKQKKSYPEIIIQPVDKLAFDSKYYLNISLSKPASGLKFYRVADIAGGMNDISLPLNSGKAQLSWYVPKPGYAMEKVIVAAEFNTALNNPVRLEKSYNLAIENR